MSTANQLDHLKALTKICAAIPAAARRALGPEVAEVVKGLGLDPLQHGYLVRKRPLAHAPASITPPTGRLDSVKYYIEVRSDLYGSPLFTARASLLQLSAFLSKSPKTLEMYQYDKRRRVNGLCQLPVKDPVGGVALFTLVDPDVTALPETLLPDAVAEYAKRPRRKY